MQIAEYNEPVAKNIAEVIASNGLKQIYIAEKAGYSPQELNDMLNGRRLIKANDIARISTALGVDVNRLYGIEKGEG
ncbi:helix-turn-helix transcriptional regulator [uncultured Eubacterium sp.]|uniref:helix-turn-helix domain-containing protein n=1 Tax=uncultured Eubacterium sp. TaxID=165185 RepID=UPI0025F6A1BF|nr:helix-turn-helix transcriptional regulator [uncultured Eubacterium sp.]